MIFLLLCEGIKRNQLYEVEISVIQIMKLHTKNHWFLPTTVTLASPSIQPYVLNHKQNIINLRHLG